MGRDPLRALTAFYPPPSQAIIPNIEYDYTSRFQFTQPPEEGSDGAAAAASGASAAGASAASS